MEHGHVRTYLEAKAKTVFQELVEIHDWRHKHLEAAGLGDIDAFSTLVCQLAKDLHHSFPDVVEAVVDVLGAMQLHLSPYSLLLQHVCEYALTLGGHLRFRRDDARQHCDSGDKTGDMAQAGVQRLLRYLHAAAPGWQVRQAVAELRMQALVRRYNRLCVASFFRSARTLEKGGTVLSMLELGHDQGAVVKHNNKYFTSVAVQWPTDGGSQPGCIAHCAAVLRRPSLWSAGWQPEGAPVCINAPCYEAWRAGRLGLSPDEYDASCMGAEEVLPTARRPHRRQQVGQTGGGSLVSGTAAAPALVMAEVTGENQVLFVQQALCERTGRTAVVLAHVLIMNPVGRSINDMTWHYPEQHTCFYPLDDGGLGGAAWRARSAAMRTRQLLRAGLHASGKVKAD